MSYFSSNNSEFDQNLLRIWARILSSLPPPKTILVTSSVYGEGCTTIATHLARIRTKAYNEKILLIESHVKNSSGSFDSPLSEPPGLSDILFKGVSLEEVVRPSTPQNLHFMGPGLEKLGSLSLPKIEALKQLLQKAKERYDFILFDGPPVLEYPEIGILANQFEGTLLVIQANKTTRGDVERATRVILNVGGKLIGCILNRKQNFVPKRIYQKYVGSDL